MLDTRPQIGQGDCIRITVRTVKGSAPREPGTFMLVTRIGQHGTIGGGRLEFEAIRHARAMLAAGDTQSSRSFALGPALGQCCGGSVTLAFGRLATMPETLSHSEPTVPDALTPAFPHPVFIYGAGHVSRALAPALQSRARANVTVFDPRKDQADQMPADVTCITSRPWDQSVACTPPNAVHYIMTPDHNVDLTLCHQLLTHGDFAFVGLIGSATKWARFRSRLSALGHTKDEISRITCPIGRPSLGKAPHSIAAGVVTQLLTRQARTDAQGETAE